MILLDLLGGPGGLSGWSKRTTQVAPGRPCPRSWTTLEVDVTCIDFEIKLCRGFWFGMKGVHACLVVVVGHFVIVIVYDYILVTKCFSPN